MVLNFKTAGRMTLLITFLVVFIIVFIFGLDKKIPEGTIINTIILIIFILIPPLVLIILDKFGLYKNCEGYNE